MLTAEVFILLQSFMNNRNLCSTVLLKESNLEISFKFNWNRFSKGVSQALKIQIFNHSLKKSLVVIFLHLANVILIY